MPQMSADTLVITKRIFKTEMVPDRHRQLSKKLSHPEQRFPGVVVICIRVSLQELLPKLGLQVFPEIFAHLPGIRGKSGPHTDIPGQHFHELRADNFIKHVPGIKDLFTPQSLGHVRATPPELVAAVTEGFGSRRSWNAVTVTRWWYPIEKPVFIQKYLGQTFGNKFIQPVERENPQIYAVAIAELG